MQVAGVAGRRRRSLQHVTINSPPKNREDTGTSEYFVIMNVCILELGTRSFRMLRVQRPVDDAGGALEVEALESERVAIDASIEATGSIGRRTWADALQTLGKLLDVARRRSKASEIFAIAPRGLRSADNGDAFLDAARRRFGIDVELLSTADSARLAYAGVRGAAPDLRGRVAVAHLDDGALDVASGTATSCEWAQTLSLGVQRLHTSYALSGVLERDEATALFELVRLCAEPLGQRVSSDGTTRLAVASENALAVRDVARAWGFLEDDTDALGRVALHALVPEILAASPSSFCRLGIEPFRANTVGTSAVILDALADLLRQREVVFSSAGLCEGAAVEWELRDAPLLAAGAEDVTRYAALAM
jgi:exopolyphosphatase/guanosine-5'-triphosphate,3'-diphosphate pyrophosphatase